MFNLKNLVIGLVATLGMATAVQASTTFDFSPATDGSYTCGTYCSSYVTTSADTVEYANLTWNGNGYKVTVSVDGKSYSGITAAPDSGGVLVNTYFDSVSQTFKSDGTVITLSNVGYSYKRTCTRSGRGQHCTSWYWIVSGTVTQ